MKSLFKTITTTILLIASTSSFAATLVTDTNNKLVGINNVLVDGTNYDVSFHNIFDDSYNVNSSSFAQKASSALKDLFSQFGIFQGSQQDYKTTAIGSKSDKLKLEEFYTVSSLVTPNSNKPNISEITYYVFVNYKKKFDLQDYVYAARKNKFNTAKDYKKISFTNWTPSNISAVPVPAAIWLFMPAMVGFMMMRRKTTPSV